MPVQIEMIFIWEIYLLRETKSDFQNVSCFVSGQSIVFHKAAIQNIYTVYYFKTSSMCIFNAVKKQSGIGFIVDALFSNFAYPHNLYIAVELYTNFVLIHFESQPNWLLTKQIIILADGLFAQLGNVYEITVV